VFGSVEAVPPSATCNRSVGAPLTARLAKAGREGLIVGLLNGSGASIAAREGLTAKRARLEMAPQRLEKVEFAPGNGPGSPGPQYLYRAVPRTAPNTSKHEDLVRGRGGACFVSLSAVG